MQKQYREQLLQSRLETQEYSFNHVSRELYDNIGQLLSSTKMLLNITGMELKIIPDTLKTAEHTIGKAIQDLRTLSKSLNNEWYHQFNLIEKLEAEKNRINAAENIKVRFLTDSEKLPLEPDEQVMLFRVMHEALQNSIKHAHPNNIVIQIKNINAHFKLSIADDGSGCNIKPGKKNSSGLHKMKYRIRLLEGSIKWERATENGTIVTILIPAKEAS